jgi:ubiquitin C-terminal hydrolase
MDTFYYEQQNFLICKNCNFNKISYNIGNIIIFPLEKVRESMAKRCPNGFVSVNLENCFEYYGEDEILTGANNIYCNNCNILSDGTTSNKIFKCPEVLTIILNRGKGLEFDVNFEYPLSLDISKYVDNEPKENCKYELICLLSHIGPSGMAGHFISFCKSPVDNKWYCYNDSSVSECIAPRNHNNGGQESIPYVLFYQKIKKNNVSSMNNTITLYFSYKEKEIYLNVDKNIKINDLIKLLKNKYSIQNVESLFYASKNICLELNKSINDYNLPNEAKITIVV